MIVKLLTEHHLEFLSLKEGCRGSSESTHVKMPHCRKFHVLAHIIVGFMADCMQISDSLVPSAAVSFNSSFEK